MIAKSLPVHLEPMHIAKDTDVRSAKRSIINYNMFRMYVKSDLP